EAVARRFSATWEGGNELHDAYLTVAGRRIAVDIATLARRGTGQGSSARLRLRFDKVATRLIQRLQATVGASVPDGRTVLLTIPSACRQEPPPPWKRRYALFSGRDRRVEIRRTRFMAIVSGFES